MTPAEVLRNLGLLDWATAAYGFERSWLTVAEVHELVTAVIVERDQPETLLIKLTLEQSELDISEQLMELARLTDMPIEAVEARWLFAALESLNLLGLSDEDLLAGIQEVYSSHGFPESLRFASPYNFRRGTDGSAEGSSPLHEYRSALEGLRTAVSRDQVDGAADEGTPDSLKDEIE